MTALYIILGIIAFFLILFMIPVGVYANYDDSLAVDVRWLFLKIGILPKKEKKKKPKKDKAEENEQSGAEDEQANEAQSGSQEESSEAAEEPQDAAKPEEKKPKKDNMFVTFYKNRGFEGVMQLLRDTFSALNGMFKGICRHLLFRKLKLYVSVGSGEPDKTAELYSKACAVVFPVMGLLVNKCKVREYDCAVVPDFLHSDKYAVFEVDLRIRPLFVINAGIVFAFKMLFKVVLKLLKPKPKKDKDKNKNISGGNQQ